MMWRSRLLLLLLSVWCTNVSEAVPKGDEEKDKPDLPDKFVTYVVSVTDGNWFESEVEGRPVSVRLYGSYAYPLTTGMGRKASMELGKMIYGQTVTVQRVGIGGHGGVIGIVTLDKKDIAAQMVAQGLSLARGPFNLPELAKYRELEDKAKEKGLNLWYQADVPKK